MNELLKRLPKKYHERVQDFYADGGLTDDWINGRHVQYKYMLLFSDGWCWDDINCVPVTSISEAIRFIKEAHRVNN